MKSRFATLIVTSLISVGATAQTICPTMPGTSLRDWSKPCAKIEGGQGSAYSNSAPRYNVNPTMPGTSMRDYSRPGMVVEGNTAYPTMPGTNMRDYSKPGYRIE